MAMKIVITIFIIALFMKIKLWCVCGIFDRDIVSSFIFDALKVRIQALQHFGISERSICGGRED